MLLVERQGAWKLDAVVTGCCKVHVQDPTATEWKSDPLRQIPKKKKTERDLGCFEETNCKRKSCLKSKEWTDVVFLPFKMNFHWMILDGVVTGGSLIHPAQRQVFFHRFPGLSTVAVAQAEWKYLADTPGAPEVMFTQQSSTKLF